MDKSQAQCCFGAAKLWYDKPREQSYLLVSLQVEVADPTPATHQQVVGIDAGQRYLAVVATPKNGTHFYSGKAIQAKSDHYARLRKRLQQKGARSATRRLVVIRGRERRLQQNCHHLISHRIVNAHPHSLIGLEQLTDIRERTKRRKGRRASKKQRRANRHASKWALALLHSYIAYKAVLSGSMAIKVDAKAARCERYAELRWSPEASPGFSHGVNRQCWGASPCNSFHGTKLAIERRDGQTL